METVILFLPILVGIYYYTKYQASEFTFYTMFMASVCCMGFYYNNMYRMGPIFPSDIYLLLFVTVWAVIHKGKMIIEKETFVILFTTVSLQFAFTFVFGYQISEALTDFKYVLYFFVPYFYSKAIWNDKQKMQDLFKIFLLAVIVSVIYNVYKFLSEGLTVNVSSEVSVTRTFGIGMGFACTTFVSLLLMAYRTEFIDRFNATLYYILQALCITSIVLSFTRTNWISYILMVVLFVVILKEKRRVLNLISSRRFLLAIGITIAFIYFISSRFPDIVSLFVDKFNSISETTTDKSNTFFSRINSILSGIDVFYSPRILVGYGYGSLYRNAYGNYYNGLENSFIYYLWKYGIFMGIYLFYRVSARLLRTWRTGSRVNRIFVIYFAVEIIIASFSGNLNSTYTVGIYSFILAINYDIAFPFYLKDRKYSIYIKKPFDAG